MSTLSDTEELLSTELRSPSQDGLDWGHPARTDSIVDNDDNDDDDDDDDTFSSQTPVAGCLLHTGKCWKSWWFAGPWRLLGKSLFWTINILAAGAHLQGPINGLTKLFPVLGLNPGLLHDVAVPFQFGDASAHTATSVLGSNEMVDGVARTFQSGQSFWGAHTSVAKRLLLGVLTLFLVVTAEVSSTYRNWQNNAGDSRFMRIFWVGFYLLSHIPEVLYSTMLMVRDYFTRIRLTRAQQTHLQTVVVDAIDDYELARRQQGAVRRRAAAVAHVHSELASFFESTAAARHAAANKSSNDDDNDNDSSGVYAYNDSRSSASSGSSGRDDDDDNNDNDGDDELGGLYLPPGAAERTRIECTVRWLSRVVGVLLAVPTYAVKTMSSVDGFQTLIKNLPALSWTLGVSGMLAEAYLEYSFTQAIIYEVALHAVFAVRRYPRSTTGHVFYATMPTVYWTLFGVAVVDAVLTLPGSYYSAYGVLSKNWPENGWLYAVCWLYAARYFLQAITAVKLLLENIVRTARCHWDRDYGSFVRALKKRRTAMLAEWQREHEARPVSFSRKCPAWSSFCDCLSS